MIICYSYKSIINSIEKIKSFWLGWKCPQKYVRQGFWTFLKNNFDHVHSTISIMRADDQALITRAFKGVFYNISLKLECIEGAT